MKKILFLDFEDSFTHNLVQELRSTEVSVEVIPWKNFSCDQECDLLVLGPGPGHPDDYQVIFPSLKKWIQRRSPILGVCLGHQIFWLLRGAEIIRSRHPSHGQRQTLKLDQNWQEWLQLPPSIQVQRYNSLVVKTPINLSAEEQVISHEDELQAARGEWFLTYQFHPESVGTMCREAFFRPVFQSLL